MKIVKELNLNKTPQGAQIGSMIFAKNIKLTLDKQAITSEEGLIDTLRNSTFFNTNPKPKILGVISNGTTVIIFSNQGNGADNKDYIHTGTLTHITDKQYTLSLEKVSPYLNDQSEDVSLWNHEGGEVFGVATRNNKGEIIVAVSERNAPSDVPLKILNLSTGVTANSTEVSPEVPFAKLKFGSDTVGNLIPTGLYYFFIRFEIDNGVWSKWQPLAYPKAAVSTQYKSVIQHLYNHRFALPSANPTVEEVEKINNTSINKKELSVRIPYNDVLYDSTSCFNFVITVSNGNVAKNAQIGYILQHENGSFGRLWVEFPLVKSVNLHTPLSYTFQFDAKWIKELPIDEFLENTFSIKNVENIAEFQGRLYVSNFKESDYNINKEAIICDITFGTTNTHYLDAGFGETITKLSGDGDFVTIFNTINNVQIFKDNTGTDTSNFNKYYLKEYPDDILYDYPHTGHSDIMSGQDIALTVGNNRYKSFFSLLYRSGISKYGEGWIDERDYLVATRRLGVQGPDDYYYVKLSDVLYDYNLSSYSSINGDNNGDSPVNNIIYYNSTSAKDRDGQALGDNLYHRFDILTFNNGVRGIGVVDANTVLLNGRLVSPKAILDMSLIQAIALSNQQTLNEIVIQSVVATSSPKDVKSIRSFLPFNKYRFFCHYVRKDGSYTNGILLKNSDTNNTSVFSANPKGESITNVGLAIRAIEVSFANIPIPPEFVGCFISYQTYCDKFGYTGYVLRDISPKFRGEGTKGSLSTSTKSNRSVTGDGGFGSERFFNENTDTPINSQGNGYNTKLAIIKAVDVESHAVSFMANKTLQLFTNTTTVSSATAKDIVNPILISGNNVGDGKKIYDSTGGNSGVSCELDSSIESGSTIVTYFDTDINIEKAPLEKLTDIFYVKDVEDEDVEDEDVEDPVININDTSCDFNYPGFVTVHNFIEYLQPVYIDEEGRVFKYSSTGSIENVIIGNEIYAQANYLVGYSRYDLNAISIKRQPDVLVGLLNSPIGSGFFGSSTTIKSMKIDEDKIFKVKHENLIYKSTNLLDLFEYKNDFIEKKYKQYIINNKNKVKDYKAVNIIRRSNVMATESDENGWNKFDANNYFVLTKNKGAITNLIVLHNQLIAHTEQSMFVFNGDNTIEQAAGNALQITSADIFALTPTEIFADNYGYGGLQIRNISAVNYAGYWFVDSNSKKLFVFNNNIADATYNFINVLEDYEIVDGCIASDIINDRVLVCLALEKTILVDVLADESDPTSITQESQVITRYITMSFDIASKKLISLHDYKFNKSVNVINRCLLMSLDVNDNIQNSDNPYFTDIKKIFTFSPDTTYTYFGDYKELEITDNLFLSINSEDITHSHKCSIIDVIFNHNYEQPKVLNSLRWIVDRIDLYGALPHDKLAEYVSDNQTNDIVDIKKYPGYKLRVYTDSTDTQNINLVGTHLVINKMDDYKVPHYEKGVWYFNYFRNYLNDVALIQDIHRWYALIKDTELVKYIPLDQNGTYAATYDELTTAQKTKLQQIKASMSFSDNRSLIYGKYFVVRFIFDMGTENKPFKLENVDVNTTIA